jgi:hypothetical protein
VDFPPSGETELAYSSDISSSVLKTMGMSQPALDGGASLIIGRSSLPDFREAQDILLRCTDEFDRSIILSELVMGLLPEHHAMLLTNERFKSQRRLIQDLMTPSFLNNTAVPQIYAAAQNLVAVWKERHDPRKVIHLVLTKTCITPSWTACGHSHLVLRR